MLGVWCRVFVCFASVIFLFVPSRFLALLLSRLHWAFSSFGMLGLYCIISCDGPGPWSAELSWLDWVWNDVIRILALWIR